MTSRNFRQFLIPPFPSVTCFISSVVRKSFTPSWTVTSCMDDPIQIVCFVDHGPIHVELVNNSKSITFGYIFFAAKFVVVDNYRSKNLSIILYLYYIFNLPILTWFFAGYLSTSRTKYKNLVLVSQHFGRRFFHLQRLSALELLFHHI